MQNFLFSNPIVNAILEGGLKALKVAHAPAAGGTITMQPTAANYALNPLPSFVAPIQLVNAMGGAVTVLLPAEAAVSEQIFGFYNSGNANNVTIKDDSNTITIAVLTPGMGCVVRSNGTTWHYWVAGQQKAAQVFAVGEVTTAGGDANESISVSGMLATDLVFVNVEYISGTQRYLLSANAGVDAIAVVMSGDPSTTHKLQYCVIRP